MVSLTNDDTIRLRILNNVQNIYIMKTKVISLNDLTLENVSNLSEEDISYLLNRLVSDLPREKRLPYANIISTVFDFRSIGVTNHILKNDLTISGYKFFPIPYNNKLIMGVRRKKINKAN